MLKHPIKSFLPRGHNNTMQLHSSCWDSFAGVSTCVCVCAHTHFKEMQNRQKVPVNQFLTCSGDTWRQMCANGFQNTALHFQMFFPVSCIWRFHDRVYAILHLCLAISMSNLQMKECWHQSAWMYQRSSCLSLAENKENNQRCDWARLRSSSNFVSCILWKIGWSWQLTPSIRATSHWKCFQIFTS